MPAGGGKQGRAGRSLATVKDAAYAWRQALFFVTLSGEDRAADLVAEVAATPTGEREPMRAVLGGLSDIGAGGRFDHEGVSVHGRRLVGWTLRRHWVLARRVGLEDDHDRS
ncbi:MAG TPA: hypothetical protein VEX66_02330 [Microlunatus sp.]|nr:hypothetical protein [Microlunatus sp.]